MVLEDAGLPFFTQTRSLNVRPKKIFEEKVTDSPEYCILIIVGIRESTKRTFEGLRTIRSANRNRHKLKTMKKLC